MDCYLSEAEDGTAEVLIQYRDEWTLENPAGQVLRRPGTIPAAQLVNSRPLGCSEVEQVLRREVEWLPEPPPEPILRVIGREAAAIIVALGLWAGISLAIVIFVWRVNLSWTSGLPFVLVPIYLPAPLAAFVYVYLARPRTEQRRVRRAIVLVVVAWVLLLPVPAEWLPSPTLRAVFFFHPIPVGMEDAWGVLIYLLVSFLPIGIPYCYFTARAAARWADRVLSTR